MNTCKLFVLSLTASLLFFSTAQAKESFRYEAGAVHHYSDDGDIEVTVMGVGGTYYFQPVNTGDHPLAEAAYLERVGKVGLQVGMGTLETDLGFDADVTRFITTVEYMKPNEPLYLALIVDRMEIDLDSPADGDSITDTKDFEFGWFIQDGLRVGAGYTTGWSENDIKAPVVNNDKTDYDSFNVNGKMVKGLDGGRAFNAEAMVRYDLFDNDADDGTNIVVQVSGDFYFTPMMSAGVGLTYNRGDDEESEGETLGANFTNFFNHQLYVSVDVEKFDADNSAGDDEDSFDVLLAYRF